MLKRQRPKLSLQRWGKRGDRDSLWSLWDFAGQKQIKRKWKMEESNDDLTLDFFYLWICFCFFNMFVCEWCCYTRECNYPSVSVVWRFQGLQEFVCVAGAEEHKDWQNFSKQAGDCLANCLTKHQLQEPPKH